MSSRAGWCVEQITPAYKGLVGLSKVGGEDFESDEEELARVFAIVTKAASELLRDLSSMSSGKDGGYSDRTGLLLGACPALALSPDGSPSCTASSLENLRRLLDAAEL